MFKCRQQHPDHQYLVNCTVYIDVPSQSCSIVFFKPIIIKYNIRLVRTISWSFDK